MAYDEQSLSILQGFSDIRRTQVLEDDFHHYVTADDWTTVAASTGTCADSDAVGGVLVITSAATDNDDVFAKQTQETWKLADGKTLLFEAKAAITEGNTDDQNTFIGLINAAAANDMVDDGAGPRTNFYGAAFYKIDGGTNWNIIYSAGTTQTEAELTAANSLTGAAISRTSGTYQTFVIKLVPHSSTLCDVYFFVGEIDEDLKLVYKIKNAALGTPTEMQATLYVKAGSANAEVLSVDYVRIAQIR